MKQRPLRSHSQLTLELRRDPTMQHEIRDETAVLQAIADLLLGALGAPVEVKDGNPATVEISHELEDHV